MTINLEGVKPMPEITRELPQSLMSAEITSYDEANDTVDVVWSTGMRGLRWDWDIGKYYEELSLAPEHVRLDRLNAGASVLNSHQSWDLSSVIGAVASGTATVDGSKGECKVRLSQREELDGIRADIKAGIIRHISVGYNVYKYELTEGGDEQIPVYRATDWEPAEISFVPIPFDYNSQTRSQETRKVNKCVFINRGDAATQPSKESDMTQAVDQGGTQPVADPQAIEQARKAGVEAERQRIAEIRKAVEVLPTEQRAAKAEEFITSGVSADAVRASVIELLATRSDSIVTQPAHVSPATVVADHEVDGLRKGLTNALLNRHNPENKLDDAGRMYRGLSLLEMGREYANKVLKVDTRGMDKMTVAGIALGNVRSGGQHTTSDFPIILANVANKTLRDGYALAPQTWKPLARQANLSDFKQRTRAQFGEAPSLTKVNESGEFTYGTIGEGREVYQLATYGKIVAISRQTLVNDDLDAFSRVPSLFGSAASRLESDLVWAQITGNPTMGDGNALFSTQHGNNAATGAAISVATIGAGRAAMRRQKGLDNQDFLNVQAQYLVVPAALETIADQFVSTAMVAQQSSNINPFAGRLQVISEPRLDAASATAWYLAATPGQIDVIEYGYLDGAEGPQLETEMGFDVDGMKIKCRLDFVAKVIDWRGLFRNVGA